MIHTWLRRRRVQREFRRLDRRDQREFRRLERARETLIRSIVVNLELDDRPYVDSMAKLQRTMVEIERRRAERASIARYQRRIGYERDIGLAYVRVHARRVRAELGLED